jgi:hypothetical protein
VSVPAPQLHAHVTLLRDSLLRLTGRDLLAYPGADNDPADAAFEAPFALVSHDGEADPIFTYGNRTALGLFELDWAQFTRLPSRLSAEAPGRDERQRLLDRVTQFGYIDDYSGVRVSATGARFRIHDAVVWNLNDEDGTPRGQAAMFATWTPL